MTWREEELEHFKRIRTDPVYRMNEQLHQMAIDTEPGIWPIGSVNSEMEQLVARQPHKLEVGSSNLPLATSNYDKQLRAEINHLKNRVHELENPTSKKRKSKYD